MFWHKSQFTALFNELACFVVCMCASSSKFELLVCLCVQVYSQL